MRIAIVLRRVEAASSVQTLKNFALVHASLSGTAVSQLHQLLLQFQQASHARLYMLNVLINQAIHTTAVFLWLLGKRQQASDLENGHIQCADRKSTRLNSSHVKIS